MQNYYNSAMTVIAQDDHLIAGAWAACGRIDNRKLPNFNSPHKTPQAILNAECEVLRLLQDPMSYYGSFFCIFKRQNCAFVLYIQTDTLALLT